MTASADRAGVDGASQAVIGAGGPHRASNDVFALTAKADPGRIPYLYLDCGTEDRLLNVNREMAALLQKQKIRYEYQEVPGGHTWDYWDRQIRQVLEALAAHVP